MHSEAIGGGLQSTIIIVDCNRIVVRYRVRESTVTLESYTRSVSQSASAERSFGIVFVKLIHSNLFQTPIGVLYFVHGRELPVHD